MQFGKKKVSQGPQNSQFFLKNDFLTKFLNTFLRFQELELRNCSKPTESVV